MKLQATRRSPPGMDLTPLIDVIFQLLLFFMLSTTFRNSPSFEVQLPEVSSDQMIQDDNSWTLTITKSEEIISENGTLQRDQLSVVLEEKVRENPKLSLVIEADQQLSHGTVVDIMDVAQQAGIQTVQIGATQEP